MEINVVSKHNFKIAIQLMHLTFGNLASYIWDGRKITL